MYINKGMCVFSYTHSVILSSHYQNRSVRLFLSFYDDRVSSDTFSLSLQRCITSISRFRGGMSQQTPSDVVRTCVSCWEDFIHCVWTVLTWKACLCLCVQPPGRQRVRKNIFNRLSQAVEGMRKEGHKVHQWDPYRQTFTAFTPAC